MDLVHCTRISPAWARKLDQSYTTCRFFRTDALSSQHTSLSNSPRIRSAPHSRLSLAISLSQGHGLWGYPWFGRSCPGLVLPIQLKSLTMPPQERLWLNDEKRLLPGPNRPCQKHQKHPIRFGAG